MDRLNKYLSSDLHNYSIVALLLLYAATVVAVLIYPQDTRLSMAKDVGTALLGVFGIVAGAHSSKAIATTWKGGANGAADPPPDGPK